MGEMLVKVFMPGINPLSLWCIVLQKTWDELLSNSFSNNKLYRTYVRPMYQLVFSWQTAHGLTSSLRDLVRPVRTCR